MTEQQKPEWETEPDELYFKSHGLKCEIRRNEYLGCLLGYVEIPKGHKYHGKEYEDIPYEAHGGLTYSDYRPNGDYLVGFDCGHCMDLSPFTTFRSKFVEETYKNLSYVKRQCEQLAKQVAEDMKT